MTEYVSCNRKTPVYNGTVEIHFARKKTLIFSIFEVNIIFCPRIVRVDVDNWTLSYP